MSWVEGGYPGRPGASTVISQPLDSKMLLRLEIPATQPWTPTQWHLGTCHTVIKVEREREKKKKGVEEGKQKNKKSTYTAEKQPLKEKAKVAQRSS